jgi:hypothetical protein
MGAPRRDAEESSRGVAQGSPLGECGGVITADSCSAGGIGLRPGFSAVPVVRGLNLYAVVPRLHEGSRPAPMQHGGVRRPGDGGAAPRPAVLGTKKAGHDRCQWSGTLVKVLRRPVAYWASSGALAAASASDFPRSSWSFLVSFSLAALAVSEVASSSR